MAHHKTIDKTRWLASQKRLAECWHGEDMLEKELKRVRCFYIPLLEAYAGKLPDTASILDIGCGPVCATRFLEHGGKTYLDPLLDDYSRVTRVPFLARSFTLYAGTFPSCFPQ